MRSSVLYAKTREADELGKEIRDFRIDGGTKIEDIARKMAVRMRLSGKKPITATTLIDKIKYTEIGNLYFGNTSLAARGPQRGQENLDRLALYLFYLHVPEDHNIIKRLKEIDARFQYAEAYLMQAYPLPDLLTQSTNLTRRNEPDHP